MTRLLFAVSTAFLILVLNGHAQAPSYKVINLRTIGPQVVTHTSWFGGEFTYTNNSSRGISINDSCVVVGASSSPLGDRGFFYKNKTMNSVGVMDSAHTWSDAYDINNKGVITGSSYGRAYFLSNNVFFDIGDGRGRSLNENGQITGDTFVNGNQAFVWSGGTFEILPRLSPPSGTQMSNGSRINEAGVIVGESNFRNMTTDYKPFKYFGGMIFALGSLAGPDGLGSANGINDLGQIVGWTQDANAGLRVKAFLVGTNGAMQNLGLIKEYTYSDAYDINNQSQVVGSLGNSNWTGEAGFLWQNGTMYDLNDLVTNLDGWTIKRGNKINNLGWIVADGSKDGVGDRALLLIPDTANTSDYDGDGVSDAREFFDKTDINNSSSFILSSVGASVPAGGDTQAPSLNLLGMNPLIIPRGSAFADPGASVIDDTDEYRTVIGTGTVDTTTVGIYTVTYTAQDLAGNLAAPVERSVFVYEPNNSLSIPTIPTSFPLTITPRPTNVLALRAWYGWNGNSYNQGKIPQTLSNVVAISSGIDHNLALLNDGTVFAWGNNSQGQSSVPTGLSNVVSISAGAYQSIALKSDGTIAVWGPSALVSQTPNLSNVVAISQGPAAGHVFALKNDGTVVAWGGYGNEYGQLSVPSDLTNAIQVAAGCYHGAAVRIDGTVITWGGNNFGQQNIPAGLSNVVAVSCSERGTLALKSDGTVVSWGDETVALPPNLGTVARVKAGRFYNAVIQLDGTIVSFGSGAPAQPADLPPVQELGVGSGWMIAGYEARDTNAPTISLIGSNPLVVYLGSSFVDPGATVNDNLDAPRTVYGSGTVNTATLGSYTLTYSASDSAFNSATPATRTVNVVSMDPDGDDDGDGLSNGQELTLGTDINQKDSDGDGVNDSVEVADGTNPINGTSFNILNKDLVAFYPFTGNANDKSGNGRHGVTANTILVADRFGHTNEAYHFNGTDSRIVVSGYAWPGGNSDRTCTIWFKAENQILRDLFAFGDGNRAYSGKRFSITLGYNYISETLGFVGENNDQFFNVGNLVDGFWHHLAVTMSSGTLTIYLDGTPLVPFNKTLDTDGSKPLVIGSNTFDRNSEFFFGVLDEMRVYSRALSSAEINSLYLQELGNLDSNLDGITDARAVSLGYKISQDFTPLLNSVKSNPVSGLYNQPQYDANRTNGQSDILNNPNASGLYTTNQIHTMGLGGIVLNRDTNNQLVLNYEVLQSTDLQNWTPYQTYQLPITNAPTNKMFLRVQAVGQ